MPLAPLESKKNPGTMVLWVNEEGEFGSPLFVGQESKRESGKEMHFSTKKKVWEEDGEKGRGYGVHLERGSRYA